jgi:zinc transporter 1/2/3
MPFLLTHHFPELDPHSRALDDPAADVPETDFSRLHGSSPETPPETSRSFPSGLLDVEKDGRVDGSSTNGEHSNIETAPLAQLVGIAILEFGVLLHRSALTITASVRLPTLMTAHSVLIGMTLAVTDDDHFRVLFVVLIIHQVFEGLGLGSRFAITKLPGKFGVRAPPLAAFLYGIATPIGIAAGLGLRNSYTPNGPTASIVSGVLDSLSAGILIYTSLVEVSTASMRSVVSKADGALQLLAHEFLFNPEMINASNTKITFAIGSMLAGCGIMALLGRWA